MYDAPVDPLERQDRIDRSDCADSSAVLLWKEPVENIDIAEPKDASDAKEPTEPTEKADPTEPIEQNDSVEPMHSTELRDAIDHRDVMLRSLHGTRRRARTPAQSLPGAAPVPTRCIWVIAALYDARAEHSR